MQRRLIVHIGTGKTGSTAIQRGLTQSADQLRSLGVYYWGLNLERATTSTRHDWQAADGIGILQKQSVESAKEQLGQILNEALGSLDSDAVAIWSNESIYERPAVYVPIIDAATRAADVELQVICFARSHRTYIQSAYKQWGIKHKTYRGPIQSFSEWVTNKREFLSYGSKLSAWDEAFGNRFTLFNYEHGSNVMATLADLLPNNAGDVLRTLKKRPNRSPSPTSLAFYALHNNQSLAPIAPQAAERLLHQARATELCHQLLDLDALYPDDTKLDAAEAELAADIELVNQLLSKQGQPSLSQGHHGQDEARITAEQAQNGLLSILLALLIRQDERIAHLEARLAGENTENA